MRTTTEALQERSPDIDRLATALSYAQGQIEAAELTGRNDYLGNRYADLTSVLETVRGPISGEGLAVTQTFLPIDGTTHLVTTLLHKSGQFLRGFLPLQGVKDHHSLGSAVTYARRYSLAAMLGVCPQGDDDDAEAAMRDTPPPAEIIKPTKKAPAKKPKTQTPAQQEKAQCLIIVGQVEGADDYLRGEGVDPGDPPPQIRRRILQLGPEGFADKIAAAKKKSEAEEVEPVEEKGAA